MVEDRKKKNIQSGRTLGQAGRRKAKGKVPARLRYLNARGTDIVVNGCGVALQHDMVVRAAAAVTVTVIVGLERSNSDVVVLIAAVLSLALGVKVCCAAARRARHRRAMYMAGRGRREEALRKRQGDNERFAIEKSGNICG